MCARIAESSNAKFMAYFGFRLSVSKKLVAKVLTVFIKPVEVPQGSVKMKHILTQMS